MSLPDRFDRAIARLLRFEGGHVNHKADTGGETKYGISRRAYPEIDIKNLTLEEAIDIYYRDYWLPIRADEIADERLARSFFEFCVHSGIRRAVIQIQMACVRLGSRLKVDGKIGPVTIAEINSYAPSDIRASFKREILRFYEAIVYSDRSQLAFLNGWKNRLRESFAEDSEG